MPLVLAWPQEPYQIFARVKEIRPEDATVKLRTKPANEARELVLAGLVSPVDLNWFL